MGTRRALSAAGIGGTAALAAVVGGASWYYAERITEPPGARPAVPTDTDRVEIVGSTGSYLTLRGPDAARPGCWGVAWPARGPGSTPAGYARVGPPVSISRTVVRPLELLVGEPAPGTLALLDAAAAPPDPAALPGVGAPADEIVVDGPLGALPAWRWPGPSETWAVLVHGRSGARHETFRLVPPLRAAGLPTLAVSYRNDPDGPASPDGRSHLGATEWEDVEAAVAWALGHGARDVVLIGLSMGGACIGELLVRSRLSGHVRALVLDAPVLDWGPVIRRAAIERGLPATVLPVLLPPTMALARRRSTIDWRGLRHFHDPADFDRPTLLFHGAADPVVPVELADAFADTRSDVVTYVRVEGAGHLWSWNLARDRYERALTAFVERVGAGEDGDRVPGTLRA
jgi:uncharacterized protein